MSSDVWLNPQSSRTIAKALNVVGVLHPLLYAAEHYESYVESIRFWCEGCMISLRSFSSFKKQHVGCVSDPIYCFCGKCVGSEDAYNLHVEGCILSQRFEEDLSTYTE